MALGGGKAVFLSGPAGNKDTTHSLSLERRVCHAKGMKLYVYEHHGSIIDRLGWAGRQAFFLTILEMGRHQIVWLGWVWRWPLCFLFSDQECLGSGSVLVLLELWVRGL